MNSKMCFISRVQSSFALLATLLPVPGLARAKFEMLLPGTGLLPKDLAVIINDDEI